MSTDSQGRPLSDDGNWAWNGSEWVPAAPAAAGPSGAEAAESGVAATTIAPSPLAGYQQPPPAPQPPYGQGFPPPAQKSRTPLILAIVGAVVVIVGVALALVFTLGSSDDKPTADGAYRCTVVGSTQSGTMTLKNGSYTLSDGGKAGAYTISENRLQFSSGSLVGATGQFDPATHTIKLGEGKDSRPLNCTRQ